MRSFIYTYEVFDVFDVFSWLSAKDCLQALLP